jgi:hypothetical protein
MARLSLSFLLLLSLFSLSLARYLPESENLLPNPDTETQPSFLPQLPKPESESESASPEFPVPEKEEQREILGVPSFVPEEKPEIAETVQYIVIPVHRFEDVRNFDNIQDIGFSLRLPMRHGHHHRHHRFGGIGHRFDHRFRRGFVPGFAAPENQMEVYPVSMNRAEGRKMEMPDMPMDTMHMKEDAVFFLFI